MKKRSLFQNDQVSLAQAKLPAKRQAISDDAFCMSVRLDVPCFKRLRQRPKRRPVVRVENLDHIFEVLIEQPKLERPGAHRLLERTFIVMLERKQRLVAQRTLDGYGYLRQLERLNHIVKRALLHCLNSRLDVA